MPADLDMVWYVESEGALWTEPPQGSQADEAYHATGNHELWLLDRGEILVRATAGAMACAMTRPA